MTTINSAKRSTPDSKSRFTLFWRLFLSLLLMLLLTSALSVSIERWLTSKQINNRMQKQVDYLIDVRDDISELIATGDYIGIRQYYHQDRGLMDQVRIINAQGEVVIPRHHGAPSHHPVASMPMHSNVFDAPNMMSRPNVSDANLPNVNLPNSNLPNNATNTTNSPSRFNGAEDASRFSSSLESQLSTDEDTYPQLADTTILAPNGQSYTIQLTPRLPLPELMSYRRSYAFIRIGLIVLFSVLVCYWFSHTLTRRIRKLQSTVHQISEGSYPNDMALSELGDDELGMLAKEVAQLSDRLNESENARRQMLSDISHELRSPLARLDIATELTRDFAPNASRYVARIEKESGRMNQLIDQIIHIQSLQMSRYHVDVDNIEPVNILALLESIKEDVNFEFQNKKVSWQWQLNIDKNKPNTYTVLGNHEQLYSAFENIIRNAFEHTKADSVVRVDIKNTQLDSQAKALQQTKAIQIDIIDAGSGIKDPADLERIFQPFVRLNTARSRPSANTANTTDTSLTSDHARGYGLGLSIAHAIIRAHDGQISAQNRQDAVTGLMIRVKLPISRNP